MKLISFHLILFSIVNLLALVSCKPKPDDHIYLFPVRVDNLWGYVNIEGKFVVEPDYSNADYFSCGLARVEKDGLFGYIDETGSVVIPIEYASATTFTENRAFVAKKFDIIYCIDNYGKEVFPLYDSESATIFHNGISKTVRSDGSVVFIDYTGRDVDQQDSAQAETSRAETSRIEASRTEPSRIESSNLKAVFKDSAWGYADSTGTLVIPAKFAYANDFYGKYATAVSGADDTRYGIIDKSGKFVVAPEFSGAKSEHVTAIATSQAFHDREFVQSFLRRYTDNGWDEFNRYSDLDLVLHNSDHPQRGSTFLYCLPNTTASGITLTKVVYNFDKEIYHQPLSILPISSGGYYEKDLPLKSIDYDFVLSPSLTVKEASITYALASSIADKYFGSTLKTITDRHYLIPASGTNPETEISSSLGTLVVNIRF